MVSTYSKGIILAVLAACVSGVSIYINKFGIGFWTNATAYTTVKNIVAVIFLTSVLLMFKKTQELKLLSKKQWLRLFIIGIIGGSAPFLLFFKALTLISASEAAFIHKTLFIWVAIFAYPLLKEKINYLQIFAFGLLLFSIYLFASPLKWSFGVSSLLALSATLLWAIETVVAKTILKEISSTTTAWARMFFGSLILILWIFITGDVYSIIPQTFNQIFWATSTGIILFVYVSVWYKALELAPATTVSSILVIAAPITTIIDGLVLNGSLKTLKFIPLFIMLVSIILISNQFETIYSIYKKRGKYFSS